MLSRLPSFQREELEQMGQRLCIMQRVTLTSNPWYVAPFGLYGLIEAG